MSGLVRTLQKRMLKKQGYTRQTQRVEMRNGVPTVVRLRRGEGPIISPGGQAVGMRWPGFARASA